MVFWVIAWFWAIEQSWVHMYTRHDRLSCRNVLRRECGGNLLQVESSSHIFRSKKVCDTWSSRRCIVENARGRSSRLVRLCSMYWKVGYDPAWSQIQHRVEWASRAIEGISKDIDGEQRQFRFHLFLGSKTKEIVLKIDEFIRQSRGEDGQLFFCSRHLLALIELSVWEWWMKFRFLQGDRKEVMRYFCKTRKEMPLTSESSSPVLPVHWSKCRRNWEIGKEPRQPTRKVGWIGKTSDECVSCSKTSHPERMQQLPKKGVLQKGGEYMRFDASEPSKKMMMDLIIFATDICFLCGICDYLGQISKDLESRQNTASVVLLPRVSETPSLSRASAADNPSNYAWIAPENLSARASTVESDWIANRAWAAEGTSSWLQTEKQQKQLSTERTTRSTL